MDDRALILLSNSRDKRDDGMPWPEKAQKIIDHNSLPSEATKLVAGRRWIFARLKGENPWLYNQRGGLCHERWGNSKLRLGPDFDGNDRHGLYREAHDRYKGRFFTALDHELGGETKVRFWDRIRTQELPIEVVFVSALYGLLLWNEPVQDYDCHFADYIREDSRTVAEKWGAVLTDALVEFISRSSQGSRGGKITRVYDLLSDSSYQSVFDWERLAGTGSRIYHRIFKADAGPDSLSKIATILVRHLDEICYGRPEFDKWLRLISIRDSSFEFSFEKSLNKNAEAAREGLLLTERQVLDQNPWLARVPAKVFNQWILAEHNWRQVQGPGDCDFGASVISFARAVEGFFRHEMKNEEASFRHILAELSKSRFARLGLYGDLSDLKEYRDRGAHSSGSPVRQSEAIAARELALNILKRAVSG